MYVCVCAFPPTKVRSVSVWPPRRTPARDTGARSKAFSSRSAALLYLCSTGVPSRRAVRRSRSGLHSRARPVTCIRGRSPSTPRSAPRQNTQPNSSSPSSYRGPFLSCPRPRFPPPPRRRDPQRARPSRRRTERPMRSRARQVPRGSVREFGWRLRSRLRALSSQPPRAPVADPRFFPSPCSPRCVPPELRGGGGGESRTAQHAFSTLCQFFVKASLEELVKNCDSGVLCHATSELFWETKTSEK